MPYISMNGRRLFYAQTRTERPDTPTLVLIHGAGGSHLHWPAELRRLPGTTVYALDLPGHDRSDGPGCDAIEEYVDVLVDFLDATGTDRAVLVGHSMGGAISQMTALTHPKRVAGLVLVGTGARLRVTPLILDGMQNEPEAAMDAITRYSWAEGAPEALAQRGRQTLSRTPPQVTHGDLLACDHFDVMDRLDEIAAPTLVISGTADVLTPHKYGLLLAQRIPDARLVSIDGGGHMMALEQPRVVAAAVRGFIADLT
jgi:pimeloyl-ACP methyl ester carboxylesterase